MTAGAAFQADICAKTGYIPLITPTGMWFAQSYNVVQFQIRQHGGYLPGWRQIRKIIPYVVCAPVHDSPTGCDKLLMFAASFVRQAGDFFAYAYCMVCANIKINILEKTYDKCYLFRRNYRP